MTLKKVETQTPHKELISQFLTHFRNFILISVKAWPFTIPLILFVFVRAKFSQASLASVEVKATTFDIAGGVNASDGDLDVGAGDQDITLGYSSDKTEDVIHSMSTRLERN